MAEGGLELDVEDWTAEAATARINQALDMGLQFTAIVAAADILAAGAIQALQSRGLRVPGDISVVGIDGLPQGQYMSPALTSVRIPMQAVGSLSLEELSWPVNCSTAQAPARPPDAETSARQPPPVNVQHRAGHVIACRRGEEHGRFGNVFRPSPAAGGNAAQYLG